MDVEVKAISRSGGEPLRFKLTSKEIITCLIIAKLEGAFWLLQHFFEFRMRAFLTVLHRISQLNAFCRHYKAAHRKNEK